MKFPLKSHSRWPFVLCLLVAITLFRGVDTALAAEAEISGIERVYIRSGPGPDQPPIGILNQGDRVNIVDVEGSWTKVETPDGKVGYVYHRYVVPLLDGSLPAAPAAPAPVAAAPTVPPTPIDQLSNELAGLRAEVAELKQKVQERTAENAEAQNGAGLSSPLYAPTSVDPTPGPREQGVGVLGVAFLALVVGWFLGAAFSRRRSRAQRPRIRF